MSPFLVGLLMVVFGLLGAFFGYRIFRIILPIYGAVAGFLIGQALLPNSPIFAFLVGGAFALVLALIAYGLWSVFVFFAGAALGGSIGAAIASGLNLWDWVGWILIIALAVLGAIIVWKIRDEAVIILTAIAGAGFVASGLSMMLGVGVIRSILWAIIFAVLAVIGIVWQWQRYRHLHMLGLGGPAAVPGATAVAAIPAAAVPAAAAAAVVATRAADTDVSEPAPAAAVVATQADVDAVVEEIETSMPLEAQSNFKAKVAFIEGVGPEYGAKLTAAGVVTVLDLLRRGATRRGRADLAATTGIAGPLILRWVNHADLFRIDGVGKQFGELLEAAGVDTVVELAQRNPTNLLARMVELNTTRRLVGRNPRADEVENWIGQAKKLPRIVEY